MQSVVRGTSIDLDVRYEDGTGTLVDPTSPHVDLIDSNGSQFLMGAVPARMSLGLYRYVFACPLNAPLNTWTANWYGTFTGPVQIGPIPDYFTVLPVGAIVPILSGSYTYDPTSDVGYIRMAIDDRDLTEVSTLIPYEQRSAIFTDEEIGQVVAATGDRNYAIATLLTFIANNRSLLIQSRRVGRTEVNFGSIRADLLKTAQFFIDTANQTPADGYAEIAWTDFALRRIIINKQQRDTSGVSGL